MSENLENKLDNLEDRIKNARNSSQEHGNTKKQDKVTNNPEAIKSGRAGSELLASIIAGWVLGFGIDWAFGTKPWGIICGMLLGFISGVYRANQTMKKNGK